MCSELTVDTLERHQLTTPIDVLLVSILLTFNISNTLLEFSLLVDFVHVFVYCDPFIFRISFWWLYCQR